MLLVLLVPKQLDRLVVEQRCGGGGWTSGWGVGGGGMGFGGGCMEVASGVQREVAEPSRAAAARAWQQRRRARRGGRHVAAGMAGQGTPSSSGHRRSPLTVGGLGPLGIVQPVQLPAGQAVRQGQGWRWKQGGDGSPGRSGGNTTVRQAPAASAPSRQARCWQASELERRHSGPQPGRAGPPGRVHPPPAQHPTTVGIQHPAQQPWSHRRYLPRHSVSQMVIGM